MEIRRKDLFLGRTSKHIIYNFFLQDLQDFTNHIKNANKVVDFSGIPPRSILKFGQCRRDCPTIWKTRFKLGLYFQLTFFLFY